MLIYAHSKAATLKWHTKPIPGASNDRTQGIQGSWIAFTQRTTKICNYQSSSHGPMWWSHACAHNKRKMFHNELRMDVPFI